MKFQRNPGRLKYIYLISTEDRKGEKMEKA